MKNQYKEALAKARAENKLVFVNFTGNACTNCHWMKANMFPRPEIAPLMKDFVLVDLYADGTDTVSEENAKMEEERLQDRFPALLRNPGSGRTRDRHIWRLYARRPAIRWFSKIRNQPEPGNRTTG